MKESFNKFQRKCRFHILKEGTERKCVCVHDSSFTTKDEIICNKANCLIYDKKVIK